MKKIIILLSCLSFAWPDKNKKSVKKNSYEFKKTSENILKESERLLDIFNHN
jgi:hypothetical protein